MTYSVADTAVIKRLAEQQGISLAEGIKLVQFTMSTGKSSLPDALAWYGAHPEEFGVTINNYNNANPSDQITPGRAQKIRWAMIGGGVLLAVVVVYVVWKKVLKK